MNETGEATGAEMLLVGTRALVAAGVPDAAQDARRLFAHALGIAPGRLTLVLPELVPEEARRVYQGLIERRTRREPVSHLTGRRQFYGRDFSVSADVLDPRPETESLIEAALARPFERVLDLGTGSGCILLTLLAEMPGSRGIGVDLSDAALSIAALNARRMRLSARARLMTSDWFGSVMGDFDLIVANPPYIATAEIERLAPEVRDWEPRIALAGGGDGLDAYRAIIAAASRHLTLDGRLLMEFGQGQGPGILALAGEAGFDRIALVPDLDGRDRILVAELTSEIPF